MLGKYITGKNVLIIIVVLILLWALYWYSINKTNVFDMMTDSGSATTSAPAEPTSNPLVPSSNTPVQPVNGGYKAQSIANPSELLPKDVNGEWTKLNQNMGTNSVIIPDLLTAGSLVGLNSVAGSLRNANLQLRSDPKIEKNNQISPWNISSIEPDISRVPFEIGR